MIMESTIFPTTKPRKVRSFPQLKVPDRTVCVLWCAAQSVQKLLPSCDKHFFPYSMYIRNPGADQKFFRKYQHIIDTGGKKFLIDLMVICGAESWFSHVCALSEIVVNRLRE